MNAWRSKAGESSLKASRGRFGMARKACKSDPRREQWTPRSRLGGETLSRLKPGATYALLAAVLFGASTPAAKALLSGSEALSPWLMAGILYLGSGLGLFLLRTT